MIDRIDKFIAECSKLGLEDYIRYIEYKCGVDDCSYFRFYYIGVANAMIRAADRNGEY